MQKVYPRKLNKGDLVRVISPARSLGIISQELRDIAKIRFKELGLKLTFGKHVEEKDDFNSSSIESRIEDLHNAFSDKDVKAVITVIGGFNSNQLLDYIDWDLIRNNPKILCGYSDITALNNSFFAKTGLVTYSGPHYSSFGQKLYLDYTIDYFKKCLMKSEEFDVIPSEEWSDDQWWRAQDDRSLLKNDGFWILNEGSAKGTLLGGNLCTFNLLHGSQYMPDLTNSVLFIEDDSESLPHHFDRDFQSIIHQSGFNGVKGIVFGRFQKDSNMTFDLLRQIVKFKKQLTHIPIIGNADFGHSDPKITFPVGGTIFLSVNQKETKLTILEH
ncbi:peptidase S66 [Candidatus Roizmanbacteria bacterium RIFOXYB2_FULL_38_10]|uniref:Peptidase S66 n=1 Tax=Candidatus Roizmanbacteria bacterium RIFOXYD1_FULL_38_12 TaxID=1802093 RepID=A0A1F7L095_9BACT|nr:MAG: peptidase S66 [Candidatus Nomurabacteria bacterium RIFOXYD2_FULL_35_12]OGK62373.1 MAG: peptidase S66 [Candidatus Roizmanbacteria bacterium RIFOXYA2_FULL_38_14]OGK63572.1 MAG: peptidase S66 [Candidatus Roizmanbacteria bacterium RIFOXYA1_FULL_37_12]OGK65418.1 MAG: peptidase S66 [Candidatus Roizmanbacteria bacterium RIFOXYB1_FULL_40_23]OGK69105.1 MAG: peptidase S66 [Candidatus Roizmanbacteria bacterium RIFOXYB2_FULL_38_10]OGK69823.1 MAG: peptidase S66 [Candidatus Roizmanbacteria bacterium